MYYKFSHVIILANISLYNYVAKNFRTSIKKQLANCKFALYIKKDEKGCRNYD